MKRSLASGDWSYRDRDSDLDWALHSPDVRTYRQRRPAGWKCGDHKKLRQVVSHFVRHSSMHGVHYVQSGSHRSSCLAKFIYRLIFGVCFFMMMASVVFLSQESFSSESVYISSTTKDGENGLTEDPLFPQYPRITICRKPAFARRVNGTEQEVLEYAYIALGYPFSILDPEELTLMLESVRIKMMKGFQTPKIIAFANRLRRLKAVYNDLKASVPDFNLTEYIVNASIECKEVFVQCIAYLYEVPCCKIFQPSLTALGICYSMMPDDRLVALQKQSRDFDFSFTVDLQNVPDTEKAETVGYVIYLSNPWINGLALQNSNGYFLINGFATLVKTRLIKISRVALFTPWHGLWTDCPKMPPELDEWDDGDRFFRGSCEKKYVDRAMQKECGCRFIMDNSNISLRECDPEDVYDCFLNMAFKDNLTDMNNVCVHPCLEYHYESDVNFYKIGGPNVSRLRFVYDGSQYNFQEYRMTTVSGFLSQIGGVMGLYVGASIITAVELISFTAGWLWYRFLPSRRVSTSEQSFDQHRKTTRDKSLYFS